VTICGCQSTSTTPILNDNSNEHIELPDDPYAEMQRLTQLASISTPDTATTLYSRSLAIAIELEDAEYLESILQNLHPDQIDPQMYSNVQLFNIENELNLKISKDVRDTLNNVQIYTRDQQDRFFRLSAHLYELEQQYDDAANALMQITPDRQTLQALNEQIWNNCTLSSSREIKQQLRSNKSRYARAWWTLADTMYESFSLVEEQNALAIWLRRNTAHPGAQFLPAPLLQLAQATVASRTIALFLPLSGRLGTAGKAIREGFLAAYYHSGYPHSILVIDTFEQDMNALYEQAVADRVDIIVGPLDKGNLESLMRYPGRRIPVLALNMLRDAHLEEEAARPESATMLQFSLAVEDEAKSVAHRVNQEGLLNIALVSSTDGWSVRAAREFKLGLAPNRKVVAELLLNDVKSTTGKLGDVLSVSDSLKRNTNLQKVIGSSAEMTPRSRKDIDVIIAMVDGLKASALISALEYHFTDDIPVFAVSHVTQRLPKSQLTQLNRIEFTEIPWRIDESIIRKNMADNFGAANRTVDPLNAFGVDAFRLLDKLELMLTSNRQVLHGGTGKLSINAQNKVERGLYWVKIQSGKVAYAW